MAKILVLNLGSTSFKFKLYDMGETENMLATGGVESIGGEGSYSITVNGEKTKGACACKTHIDAMEMCMDFMSSHGLPINMDSLDAVGYKAVNGGKISGSHIVDEELISEMRRMVPLAPAHNPVYLAMMLSVREKYPKVTQIACFETSFHATIPLERAVYAVPYEWVEKYGIRRWGYHGSSHSYIAWKMGQEAPEAKRVISVHLGGSSSLCAIKDGKSIAASMGATPQSGIFHNNRVGDFDPFCLTPLVKDMGSLEAALKALSSQSGWLGLSGVSNDMRDVELAEEKGNEQAHLALMAYADNIVGYIGQFTAYLGGLDAVVFTGGIGMNDAWLRAEVAERLSHMGIKLDPAKNVRGYEGKISAPDSKVAFWSLETNEEVMVARGCMKVLAK